MKIVFVSNYFNHHQRPFCEAMRKKLGEDFVFISTSVMSEERKKLGYAQDNFPDYVLLSYESPRQQGVAVSLINEADVVIAGSAPDSILSKRIRSGKLLLRYAERPFKRKTNYLKKIYHAVYFRKRDWFRKNIYMLCAGAYTASDYGSVGMYKKRTYKWGYFPEVQEYDIDQLLSTKKTTTIVWCGRFIDWKHPDDAIVLAKKLKENGYAFQLNMVGTGIMEYELKKLVEKMELSDVVRFTGPMSPVQVRTYMEDSGIYLFTSDHQEGWGAVLNEAMNSACAVVASCATGAAPFLICDGENGYIYPSGDMGALFEKVKHLLDNPDRQGALGRNAYHTIIEQWNAELAAERLCLLAQCLMSNGDSYPDLYDAGPCSRI